MIRPLIFVLIALVLAAGGCAEEEVEGRRVLLLEIQGVIGPATSDFIQRGIRRAEETGAELVILRMDTPGGLDSSMRDIIRKILAATVPVATFVAPSGSRAASAGTYIMYASHVAAMAPATNLGSATPVQFVPTGLPGGGKPESDEEPADSDAEKETKDADKESSDEQAKDEESSSPKPATAMERKIINDAVAYIRGLAKMRGRNVEWAEKAVREGANLTAEDAMAERVIDLMAPDTDALLVKLNGREVKVLGETRALDTQGLAVVVVEPDWRSRLLAIITNPNVAYLLMLLGFYGLFFELSNPGNILPGVAGAICLLLAFYAFQVLPVNYAGLALIALGIAFMVGEAFMPSFGALGIGGVIAFVIGSLILMETDIEDYEISIPFVITLALVSVAFVVSVVMLAVRQRKRPVVSGREEMLGSVAEVVEGFAATGRVRTHGEVWNAKTLRPVETGQRVRVQGIDGLTLSIEPLEKED